MDASLRRFLADVRPRARGRHLAIYEDAVSALDRFLVHRRRRARSLRPCELRSFLGYWYLRNEHLLTQGAARRFCAAVRVVVGWLSAEWPQPRAHRLRAEVAMVARDTVRAARASELLQTAAPAAARARDLRPVLEDAYWEVVLRGSDHVVLRGLLDNDLVGPVQLPGAVVRSLAPGAVLNLQLGRTPAGWILVEPGPCYPPIAAPALRAACLSRA